MRQFAFVAAVVAILAAGPASAQTGATNTPRSGVPGAPSQLPSYQWGSARAEAEGYRVREPGNPLQQKAAGEAATEAGVACDVTSAAVIKDSRKAGVHTVTYEVACRNDFGWIITKAGDKISAYDCLALAASAKAAKGKLAVCGLAANLGANATAGLANLTKKAGLTCKPVQGVYMGGGGEPAISRYEVLCDTGAGYVIDTPQPKSKAAMLAMSCDRAKAVGMGACALKPAKG